MSAVPHRTGPSKRGRVASQVAGFTLLEVMVAIAILGLALTAIFSSEAGVIRMAGRTAHMGNAALMARCKMLEIEEQVMEMGLPAVYDSGSDNCCEDSEIAGISCEWEVSLVVLPDTMFMPEETEEEDLEGEEGLSEPGTDLDALAGADPTSVLTGAAGGGFAAMAIQQVFPILKPAFESQIRRATVTVHWKEGSGDKSFQVTQYLVAEEGVAPDLGTQDTTGTGSTGTGTGTSTGSGN